MAIVLHPFMLELARRRAASRRCSTGSRPASARGRGLGRALRRGRRARPRRAPSALGTAQCSTRPAGPVSPGCPRWETWRRRSCRPRPGGRIPSASPASRGGWSPACRGTSQAGLGAGAGLPSRPSRLRAPVNGSARPRGRASRGAAARGDSPRRRSPARRAQVGRHARPRRRHVRGGDRGSQSAPTSPRVPTRRWRS